MTETIFHVQLTRWRGGGVSDSYSSPPSGGVSDHRSTQTQSDLLLHPRLMFHNEQPSIKSSHELVGVFTNC